MLGIIVDGADAVSAHQALQASLTEAWEAVGAPTSPPSPTTLATLTTLCREDLPASLHMTGPVKATSTGLTVTAALSVPVPLGSTGRWAAVGQLPITWTAP